MADKYILGEIVGEGSTAEVFRAKYMGNEYAVKRTKMRLGYNASAIESKAADEFAMVKVLGPHPNIVQPIALYVDAEQRLCIVMDYAAGGSAKSRVEGTWGGPAQGAAIQGRLFSPHGTARLALEMARAFEFIHLNKLIHCDVKPGNIVFTADGTAQLADFGAATVLGAIEEHFCGSTVGTPE